MSEAIAILQSLRVKLRQLHVSEVNTQSKHDPLSLESVLEFHRVSHLVSPEVPIITESRVEEVDIREKIERALDALSPESLGEPNAWTCIGNEKRPRV